MHLGMRTPADIVFSGELGHANQIAFHGVEVDYQGGRVDVVNGFPYQ
jgi:hypothetical protein